jgi:hypothetical protein
MTMDGLDDYDDFAGFFLSLSWYWKVFGGIFGFWYFFWGAGLGRGISRFSLFFFFCYEILIYGSHTVFVIF